MVDVNNFDYMPVSFFELTRGQTQLPFQVEFINPVYTPPTVPSPVVFDFHPAAGTAVQKTQTITLSTTGTGGLTRAILAAQYPNIGLYEIIHDGDSFTSRYPPTLGNVRTAISGGYTFTVLRQEGWPASPRLLVFAADHYGQFNDVSGTNYAWTLV